VTSPAPPAASPAPRDRLLPVAVLLVLGMALPFALGRGIDLPDDALYYTVSSWEWLRVAWTEGLSPWFVPGKLGGVGLYSDIVPMGPFYPASWLLFVLPVHLALPLAVALHAVGTLLSVRWMARTFGASPAAATLAGAAVAAGPLGAVTLVDCHVDVWPLYLWFPVVLGAQRRMDEAPELRHRVPWAALAGAGLALMLLGSHMRFSVAAFAAWGVLALLRGPRTWGWAAAIGALGLLGGAPGFLPNILELQLSTGGTNRLAELAGPAHESYRLLNLPGWLAPKPHWYDRDFSLGAVLGVAFLAALPGLSRPARRLALFVAILAGAALSPSIPGMRWLFAPLLIVTHPISIFYTAIALIPAAAVAALGVDRLTADPSALRHRAVLVTLAVLAALALVRAALPALAFEDPDEWRAWLGSVAFAALALGLAVTLLQRRRTTLLGLVVLAEIGVVGARVHGALPSEPIPLATRTAVDGLDELRDGYLDVSDLAGLDDVRYATRKGFFDATDFMETGLDERVKDEVADFGDYPWDQADDEGTPDVGSDLGSAIDRDEAAASAALIARRWPVHLGLAEAIPGLAGRAKIPPRRAVIALQFLSWQLVVDPDAEELTRLEDLDRALLRPWFRPGALGHRVLVRYGIPLAVDQTGVVGRAATVAPPCWAPPYTIDDDPVRILGDVLSTPFSAAAPVRLEADPPSSLGRPADLDCPRTEPGIEADSVTVSADEPSLVVLRRRWHPGLEVRDDDGVLLPTAPADFLHTAVFVPAGDFTLDVRFVPLGLRASVAAMLFAWALLATGWFVDPRARLRLSATAFSWALALLCGVWLVAVAVAWDPARWPALMARGLGHLTFLSLAAVLLSSPLARLHPERFAGLVRYRRALGIAALVPAVLHFAFVLWSTPALRRLELEPATDIPGLVGLGSLLVLGATSNARAQRALGPRWKTLHRTLLVVAFGATTPAAIAAEWTPIGLLVLPVALTVLLYRVRYYRALGASRSPSPPPPDAPAA